MGVPDSDGWTEGLPTEPGDYWFYRLCPGYPSLCRVKQGNTSNASGRIMSIADDFLYPENFNKTTRRIWHKRLTLPAPPVFDRTCPECKDAGKWEKARCFGCKATGEI